LQASHPWPPVCLPRKQQRGNSNFEPVSKENPNNPSEILHRFAGITKENELFFVQIKEDKKTGKKRFMSAYPDK